MENKAVTPTHALPTTLTSTAQSQNQDQDTSWEFQNVSTGLLQHSTRKKVLAPSLPPESILDPPDKAGHLSITSSNSE